MVELDTTVGTPEACARRPRANCQTRVTRLDAIARRSADPTRSVRDDARLELSL
jgi:hypothetical protein